MYLLNICHEGVHVFYLCSYKQLHVHLHVHVCSVIETRQSKATTPKDNSSFFLKRKRRAASSGIRTHNVLHAR